MHHCHKFLEWLIEIFYDVLLEARLLQQLKRRAKVLGGEVMQRSVIHCKEGVDVGKPERPVKAVAIALQTTNTDKVRLIFKPPHFVIELAVVRVFMQKNLDWRHLRDERLICILLVNELLG